jgi:hypothetical protein
LRGCVSLGLLAIAGTVAASACSAGGDGSNAGGRGGTSGSGTGGTINPMGGSSGVSSGGSGGGINPSGGSSGTGTIPLDGGCTGVSEQAENQMQPADIVVIVDNSGSMTFEAAAVQNNMNSFAQAIIGANIDPHVALISAGSDGQNGVCVPAQLGSGACPNDSNPPIYKRIDQEVGSRNPLTLLLQLFPQYQDIFRAGASKHFFAVTDDNSEISAADFNAQITPLLQGVDPQFRSTHSTASIPSLFRSSSALLSRQAIHVAVSPLQRAPCTGNSCR